MSLQQSHSDYMHVGHLLDDINIACENTARDGVAATSSSPHIENEGPTQAERDLAHTRRKGSHLERSHIQQALNDEGIRSPASGALTNGGEARHGSEHCKKCATLCDKYTPVGPSPDVRLGVSSSETPICVCKRASPQPTNSKHKQSKRHVPSTQPHLQRLETAVDKTALVNEWLTDLSFDFKPLEESSEVIHRLECGFVDTDTMPPSNMDRSEVSSKHAQAYRKCNLSNSNIKYKDDIPEEKLEQLRPRPSQPIEAAVRSRVTDIFFDEAEELVEGDVNEDSWQALWEKILDQLLEGSHKKIEWHPNKQWRKELRPEPLPVPEHEQIITPKPDVTVGLSSAKDAWTPSPELWQGTRLAKPILEHLEELETEMGIITDPTKGGKTGFCFPFLVIELKRHQGTLIVAENQAAGGGACALVLLEQLWGDMSLSPMQGSDLRVYSITAQGPLTCINAHFRDTDGKYTMTNLECDKLGRKTKISKHVDLLADILAWGRVDFRKQVEQGLVQKLRRTAGSVRSGDATGLEDLADRVSETAIAGIRRSARLQSKHASH